MNVLEKTSYSRHIWCSRFGLFPVPNENVSTRGTNCLMCYNVAKRSRFEEEREQLIYIGPYTQEIQTV